MMDWVPCLLGERSEPASMCVHVHASGLLIYSDTERIDIRSTPEFGLLFSAEGYRDGSESPWKNRAEATPP
jgi:hypothetical protein